MHRKKMKNTDRIQRLAKILQAIGLAVVFFLVAVPGGSFGQTPVESQHSAVPPPATAIAPEEVAATLAAIEAAQLPLKTREETLLGLQADMAANSARCDEKLAQILKARNSAVRGIVTRESLPVWSPELWAHTRIALPRHLLNVARTIQTSFRHYLREPSRGMLLHAALL
jgi:hypothetical protein